MSRAINFSNNDINIISMTLIDNAVIGNLNSFEYTSVWNILDKLCEAVMLSNNELRLICDSLHRYSLKYQYERYNVNECNRIYNIILEVCRHE